MERTRDCCEAGPAEPGVDQSPAVWKAKREARAKQRRLESSQFEVRGVTDGPTDLLNGVYKPEWSFKEHQQWSRKCCGACPCCPHYTTARSTDKVWIQFNDTVRRYQFKQGSGDSKAEMKSQAVVLMQSSVIGEDTPAPAPPDAPAPARGRAKTPSLEPPVCSPEEASGWEVYNAGSQQWESQPDVVIKFHSFLR